MKRNAALLIALAMLLSAFALAVEGQGYPAWDGAAIPDDSLCASIGGEDITLRFDPSQDYSNVAEGSIQACFYAYDATGQHYLELYLLLPEGASSGDRFANSDGSGALIDLSEVSMSSETYFCADDIGSDGSSFELSIESAERSATSIAMQGSFRALLRGYDEQDRALPDSIAIEDAHFSFTLPLSGVAPRSTPAPLPDDELVPAPEATDPPTLPDEPQATFPTLPDEPQATFPALPDEPQATFPALPDEPHAGDRPSFTLPPYYAEI